MNQPDTQGSLQSPGSIRDVAYVCFRPVGSFARRTLAMSDGAKRRNDRRAFAHPPVIEWYASSDLRPAEVDIADFRGTKGIARVHPASARSQDRDSSVGDIKDGCLNLYIPDATYLELWSEMREGRLPNVNVHVPFGEGISTPENSLFPVWDTKSHPSLTVIDWSLYFSLGQQPTDDGFPDETNTRELTTAKLDAEVGALGARPPAMALRLAWLFTPFAVKLVAGFEWAVLCAILAATLQICAMIRAVVIDTTTINLIKRYESKTWDP